MKIMYKFFFFLVILLFNCRGQKLDSINEINTKLISNTIEAVAVSSAKDSANVIIEIPKTYKVTSGTKISLTYINYFKKDTKSQSSIYVKGYDVGEIKDTVNLYLIYLKKIHIDDFTKIIEQDDYLINHKYEVLNSDELQKVLKNHIGDNLNFMYSPVNNMQSKKSILIPVSLF